METNDYLDVPEIDNTIEGDSYRYDSAATPFRRTLLYEVSYVADNGENNTNSGGE